jgi:hypothetical protein
VILPRKSSRELTTCPSEFYTYSVEALLIVFWAFQLLKGMSETRSQTSRFHSFSPDQIEMASKVFAIIIPGLLLGIIQIDAIKSNIFAFVILCDLSCKYMRDSGASRKLIVAVLSGRQFDSWKYCFSHDAL